MAVFGLYYTKNMLRIMKWPRTKGLRKKEYIDATIFDSTVEQMVDWAASIGAGKPKLALQIIAYMFSGADWESDDAPDIKEIADLESKRLEQEGLELNKLSPHEVYKPVQLKQHFGDELDASIIMNKDIQKMLEQCFMEGLVYGLSHPDEYEDWYENHLKDFEKNKEIYKQMDIGVEKLPTLEETYEAGEEVVRNYEQELEIKLPPIPDKLLADAKALRKSQ